MQVRFQLFQIQVEHPPMTIENQKSMTYLDHNATTRPDPDLLKDLVLLIQNDQLQWGNPSSIHLQSREPKNILRETRKLFAEIFNELRYSQIFAPIRK